MTLLGPDISGEKVPDKSMTVTHETGLIYITLIL